ncbi:MAG: hypothetical protein EBZ45_06580, partial [Actinobacteria bacterium]|nr:hypothetical protein [Actinomycetota bacterium]
LAPALDALFCGISGTVAIREDADGRKSLRCRTVPAEGLAVVASRSHGDERALDAFLAGRRVASRVNAGSSLKLCLLAEGRADLYPRLGRTMEWDIAAGALIAREAGCRLGDFRGGALRPAEALVATPAVFDSLSAMILRASAPTDNN